MHCGDHVLVRLLNYSLLARRVNIVNIITNFLERAVRASLHPPAGLERVSDRLLIWVSGLLYVQAVLRYLYGAHF